MAATATTDENAAFCESRLKSGDRTAWLAALFAPEAKRPALHAVEAFALDVSAVRGKVREPLAGELRLQWWTDAIEGEARGDVRGHPVAAALIDTIHRYHLPRASFTGYLDAKRDDLYDEPLSSLDDYRTRADRIEGALIGIKAHILAGRQDTAVEEAARHAGRAIAVADTIRALASPATPMHMTVPLDLLKAEGIGAAEVLVRRPSSAIQGALAALRAEAVSDIAALRARRRTLTPEVAPAFLKASLVVPTLKRLRDDPFTATIDLPQWRRQWLLWRAAGRNGVL